MDPRDASASKNEDDIADGNTIGIKITFGQSSLMLTWRTGRWWFWGWQWGHWWWWWSNDNDNEVGVHPNSHKHFIPYMGFCASIWDSVRHHCHHHYHHHDHQKWRCDRTAFEQILIRTPPLPSLNKVDSWPEHLHNILVGRTSLKYSAVLGKTLFEK